MNIVVRNLRGAEWIEQWDREKLAYFILMSNLPEPKFQNSLITEWVPYNTNVYKWDKGSLTLNEFESIRGMWPGGEAVPFDPKSCDRVQFVCRTSLKRTGFGFYPNEEPELFDALLKLGGSRIVYERFAYDFGRHVYLLRLDAPTASGLLLRANLRSSFGRICPTIDVIRSQGELLGLDVRFQCRHGSFEPPFQLWFEI